MRKSYKKKGIIFTCVIAVISLFFLNDAKTSEADSIKRTSDYNLNTSYEVSVLSQNLRLATFDEFASKNNIFFRYSRIEQLCENYDTDIKCFQECDKTWRFKLNKMLPEDEYFVEYMSNVNGLSNPIYVRKDKFTILDSGNFELNDVYELNGKTYENRIASWVKVQSKVNGETLTMVNTHLSLHNSRQIPSCEKLMAFVKGVNTDGYLISGDFNFTMDHSKKYGIMTSNGTKDMAYAAKNEGITGVMSTTSHGFGSDEEYRRIDYFFGSATLTAKMYTVLNDLYNGGFTSDHFGILTYVDINKAN